MNNSIELYRAAIGTFNTNKRTPTPKPKFSNILSESLNEILYVLMFMAFFVFIVLKNILIELFSNLNIFSTILFLFLKPSTYCLTPDLGFQLLAIASIENLAKKHQFNPKNLLWDFFWTLFSINFANLLFICGDVELNPGDTFDFCLWNCNSLPAHHFSRVSLIETYNSIHNLKIIALTETALKHDTDNSKIDIPGFSILRNDLPDGHTHGGVMIYYKNDLAVKHRPDLQLHDNTLSIEIKISRKKIIFIVAYRKFGQSPSEFETFQEKIDEMIKRSRDDRPHCTIVTGDLNAHLREWYGSEDDNFGLNFQRIFNKHSLTQLINQPTYVTNNSRTCIDIIATDQPNLFLKSEIHPSLHTNCPHQVVYAKMSINCPPPPPHSRQIWHYSRAKPALLRRAATEYDWDQAFGDSHPSLCVDHFDEVILNIAQNFIPNEVKTFNAKEPPWITKSSKNLYSKYKKKYKNYVKNNFPPEQKVKIDELREEYTKTISADKDTYMKSLGKQLADPNTGQKKYWTILKKLLKKNACSAIPPILYNNNFVVEAEAKCKIFNDLFKNNCNTTSTTSTLPPLFKVTPLSLNRVDFTEDNVTEHIRRLNHNKAHGHDNIPIRILKLFDKSISKPLYSIYRKCVSHGYFPQKWKMANVIPIHKKNEKNLANNYRPISLLPICGKIFEKLIFENLYQYIFSNNFISDNQSGYKRGDSTIKQLLAITHDIHQAFDDKHEIRAVFLDISKAFDSVWHQGLVYKLKRIGIEGDMINIIESFLSDRKQRVTIDGKFSDWVDINAGVPQGSLLGPILFLVYINDIVDVVESKIKIFADDTFIYRTVDQFCTTILNKDLESITKWAWMWKLVFNPDISKQAVEVIFSNKSNIASPFPLTFNGIPVKQVKDTKHLGLILDSKLNFSNHMNEKLGKARSSIGVMKQVKKWVDTKSLENIYKLYVRPHLEYGDLVFEISDLNKTETFSLRNTNEHISTDIESIQYQAARIVSGAWKGSSIVKLYAMLGWESMQNRRTMRKLCLIQQILVDKSPSYLYKIIEKQLHRPNSRLANRQQLINIAGQTNKYKKSFFPSTIVDWNNIDFDIKTSKTKNIFKKRLLNKIRPKKASFFNLKNTDDIRNLTMIRLNLSPLRAHKHNYNFSDTPHPFCSVCGSIEDTNHYLLLCKSFRLMRSTLMQKVSDILCFDVSTLPKKRIVSILLYGKEDICDEKNSNILRATTFFIQCSKRFDK